MSVQKRHKLIVEITDMELGLSTKDMTHRISDATDRGLYEHGLGSYLINVQVKNFKRVMAAKARAENLGE